MQVPCQVTNTTETNKGKQMSKIQLSQEQNEENWYEILEQQIWPTDETRKEVIKYHQSIPSYCTPWLATIYINRGVTFPEDLRDMHEYGIAKLV